MLLVAVWLSVLVIIGGAPTVLYVMTYSLPDEHILPQWLHTYLSGLLALYLSVVSSFIIPALSQLAARCILCVLRRDQEQQHALQTIMAIIVRTLLIIVIPCVAVIIFSDGCYRGWTLMWDMCTEDENSFHRDVEIDYFQYYDSITGDNGYGTLKLELVAHDDICPKLNTKYLLSTTNGGTCGRSVLSVLGPLLLKKVMYAVLFSSLEPLVWRAKH